MSVLPLNLIKGTRSVAYERLENTEDMDDVEHQIEKLKSKVGFFPAAGGCRDVCDERRAKAGRTSSALSSTTSVKLTIWRRRRWSACVLSHL